VPLFAADSLASADKKSLNRFLNDLQVMRDGGEIRA